VESYFTHGLGNRGAGYGFDLVRLGGKHQLPTETTTGIDTSIGLNTSSPVGHPPLSLTDGFTHISPYVTFSRAWPGRPDITPFVSVGTDLMRRTSVPGAFTKNQPHSDSMGASVGAFYDRGTFKYTLVTSYWTTALIGQGSRHYTSVNPSVLFQLPPALKFHAKGNWIFGLGFKANFGPDGTDTGVSAKLRGEFKLSHLFRSATRVWDSLPARD
jgi:hypothetical protein